MDSSTITARLESIPKGVELEIDGVSFSGVSIVKLFIDGQDISMLPAFENSLVYYEELWASGKSSGTYLLFTSACGVADSAGWDKVLVQHDQEQVKWTLHRDDFPYEFTFSRVNYCNMLKALKKDVERSNQEQLTLEPSQVIFPE